MISKIPIALLILLSHNLGFSNPLDIADSEGLQDTPYELLYYKISENGGFMDNLKYPPFRRCVIPERLIKKNGVAGSSRSSTKNWRLYWSKLGWSAYYFGDGEETINWEWMKENGVDETNFWEEAAFPVALMIIWTIFACLCSLFSYPLISMLVFRFLFLVWEFLSNGRVIEVFRFLIIKNARLHRDHILRVFQDAGRRPPFYRYSLPKFVRKDPYEAVPKELDETDDEFWSSDEELTVGLVKGHDKSKTQLKTSQQKPTPEFTPQYRLEDEEVNYLSDDMFEYLLKVKQHGMFAVWTEGVTEIDLKDVQAGTVKPKGFQWSKIAKKK